MNRRERAALTRRPGDTDDHLELLAAARRTTLALRRTERAMNLLLDERRHVFVAGRDLDPPLTYSRMGDACGVTEGAVMQVVVKAHRNGIDVADAG